MEIIFGKNFLKFSNCLTKVLMGPGLVYVNMTLHGSLKYIHIAAVDGTSRYILKNWTIINENMTFR